MARKKTQEEFEREVQKVNPHIEISGVYLNGNSKIQCKCKKCNNEWTSTARNLIKKTQCLNCFHKERIFIYPNIPHNEFIEIVNNSYPNLIITGTYDPNKKLITCKCTKCNCVSRVRTQMLLESTYECRICKNGKENIKIGINDIKSINPVMYEMLQDKGVNEKHSINSRSKADFICPSCGATIKSKTIDKVNRLGLKCKCQDGNSLGEKYFFNVIQSVSNNVESEKYLNNNLSYRYDFYGVEKGISWICEIQGKQHYGKTFETCGGRTLIEEQLNDKLKKEYAISQGIHIYVEIDSKESGLNQLKAAILNSKLTDIFCFKNVDWISCYKNALISDVLEVCRLWNSGYKVMQISNITRYNKGKVRSCLIKGNSIGMCKYDNTVSNKIKVQCVDTGEIFNSLREAEIKHGIKRGNLSAYLKGLNLQVDNKKWKYVS